MHDSINFAVYPFKIPCPGGQTLRPDIIKNLSPLCANALDKLGAIIQQMPQIAVAYSGGMDSSFLTFAARFFKPDACHVFLVNNEFMAQKELDIARKTSKKYGFNHSEIKINILKNNEIINNPKNRCYYCKKLIFSTLINYVHEGAVLCEGSVIDDQNDYRPGKQAVAELKIRSPLSESNFDKAMIAEILRTAGYDEIIRPGQSCLATRIASGVPISLEDLQKIEAGENILSELGFVNSRLRLHGSLARIELLPKQIHRGLDVLHSLTIKFKMLGFTYICIDTKGYQQGSMNG